MQDGADTRENESENETDTDPKRERERELVWGKAGVVGRRGYRCGDGGDGREGQSRREM